LKKSKSKETTLLFLHIPKCAGTTLTEEILVKRFSSKEIIVFYELGTTALIDRLKAMSKREQQMVKCIAGHFAYGIHKFYLARPCSYITVLREPIDRVVSHYYYVLRRTDHYMHKEVTEKEISLKQYVESGLSTEMDNGQTRILAGIGQGVPFGKSSEAMLEKAREHLDQCDAVGITEEFNGFLELLGHKTGWAISGIADKNVTANRAQLHNLDKDTMDVIKHFNRFDMELYQHACTLFKAQYSGIR
jgi:hypothetical protein